MRAIKTCNLIERKVKDEDSHHEKHFVSSQSRKQSKRNVAFDYIFGFKRKKVIRDWDEKRRSRSSSLIMITRYSGRDTHSRDAREPSSSSLQEIMVIRYEKRTTCLMNLGIPVYPPEMIHAGIAS
jgi:hypothetical protein